MKLAETSRERSDGDPKGEEPEATSNPSLSAIYNLGNKAPVAQLDRVPGYEPGGREFESLRARHINQRVTLFLA